MTKPKDTAEDFDAFDCSSAFAELRRRAKELESRLSESVLRHKARGSVTVARMDECGLAVLDIVRSWINDIEREVNMSDSEGCKHCGSECMVPCIEEVLDGLRGNREHFREILTDTTGLLRKVCRYAEIEGKRRRRPAWSIIGEITGHGSGVSSAIYQLYRWSRD